jgi:hypothetical protein
MANLFKTSVFLDKVRQLKTWEEFKSLTKDEIDKTEVDTYPILLSAERNAYLGNLYYIDSFARARHFMGEHHLIEYLKEATKHLAKD